jgi:hypothetical protein
MPPARRSSLVPTTAVTVTLLVHAALDVVLIVYPWNLNRLWMLAALAIPIGQNGLVALWAATHRSPSYVRCAGFSLALVATGYVALRVMTFDLSNEDAAAWGISFAVQSIVTVVMLLLMRIGSLLSVGSGDAPRAAETTRFSLATLLLWMAALTVPLVLLRLGITQFGWTTRVFGFEYSPHLAVIGGFNGVFGVVVSMSLTVRGPAWLRLAGGCLVVAALAAAEPYLLTWAFTTTGGMDLEASLPLAGGQLLVLYGTLIPLQRAAGRKAGGRRRPSAAPAPSG